MRQEQARPPGAQKEVSGREQAGGQGSEHLETRLDLFLSSGEATGGSEAAHNKLFRTFTDARPAAGRVATERGDRGGGCAVAQRETVGPGLKWHRKGSWTERTILSGVRTDWAR